MATAPTIRDLRRAGEITDQDIDTAVDAYLARAQVEPFRFASGYEIDLAAAVHAHQPAKAAVWDPDRSAKFKRNMLRTAILLAHPVKG